MKKFFEILNLNQGSLLLSVLLGTMGSTWLHHLYHYLPAFCMKPTLDLCPTHPAILQNTCLNISSFFPSLLNWKAQSWTSYSSVVSSAWIEDDDNFIGFALTTFLVSSGISFIILTERAPLGCIEPGAHHHPSGRTPTPALLSQPVLTHGIVLPRVLYFGFLLAALQDISVPLSCSLEACWSL